MTLILIGVAIGIPVGALLTVAWALMAIAGRESEAERRAVTRGER